MPLIEWNDSLSLGVPEIDRQHMRWAEIYNEMDEKLIYGTPDILRDLAKESIKQMIEYTQYHFSFEEEHMQKIRYPEFNRHKKIHDEFIKRLDEYRDDIETSKIVLNTKIIKVIRNWLLDHIMVEDKKFSRFSKDRSE